jgi:subfamily B ATP-binding cassette protein MsbA
MKKLSRIFGYFADYKGKVALYIVTTLLQVTFSVFSLAMLAPTLQVLFSDGPAPKSAAPDKSASLLQQLYTWVNNLILSYDKVTALLIIISIIVGCTILKNLFVYLSQSIINPLRHSIIRRLRNDLFQKTLSLPLGFFTEEHKGDLISRMTNDVNEVQQSVVSGLEVLVREPITILFLLISMLVISPQMMLFLILFLPVGYLIGRIGKSLRKHSNVVQEQLGRMLSVIDETIAGMRVVKAFNAEKHQNARFSEINDQDFRLRNRIAYRRELGSPLSETMGVIVIGAILWYGGNLIFEHKTSGGLLFTFIAMVAQIINPFKSLSGSFLNIRQGTAALDRIELLLNTENTVKELPDAKPVHDFEKAIELRDVSFHYGERVILNHVNLRIDKGKTIALVGASGAGKSTLVDLIPRFHDVSGGEILIDGENVKNLRIHELRKLIGVVSQDPILFNDTIYENITLGNGNTSMEKVEEAATIAHAHKFIVKKPDGYDSVAGDRGSRLSGGERQRVTIARAVLKNPPILILDEATSSLDTESERMVQDAINSLMKNRTCIVIAHRLSTVQNADQIIVLDSGSVIEQGRHEELMAKNGSYRRLVDMQQVR